MKPYIHLQINVFGLENDDDIPITIINRHSRSGKSLSGLETGIEYSTYDAANAADSFKSKEEFLAYVNKCASIMWDQSFPEKKAISWYHKIIAFLT